MMENDQKTPAIRPLIKKTTASWTAALNRTASHVSIAGSQQPCAIDKKTLSDPDEDHKDNHSEHDHDHDNGKKAFAKKFALGCSACPGSRPGYRSPAAATECRQGPQLGVPR